LLAVSLLNTVAKTVVPLAGAARHAVEKAAFVGAMNLPPHVQRRLAGKPVVLDGQTLAVDTQLMLRLTQLSGEPDPSTLSIPDGRRALARQSALAGGTQRIGAIRSLTVAGLPARLYLPTEAPAVGPLLVFLHGGGFIFGDLDSHDASCRYLAETSGVRVLAIDYRLAPEDPFPAAYDDSVAAFDWAVDHAAELGADPARIGVGGDSAGGNLAAEVALHARERCAFQLLVYPVTQTDEQPAAASCSRRASTSPRGSSRRRRRTTCRPAPTRATRATRRCTPRSPRVSRRRTSPPRASTRSATRARPTRASSRTPASRSP